MWEKTIDTKDVISYEFHNDRLRSIIEARFNKKDSCWDIFHTSFSKDNRNITQEFTASTKDNAEKLILTLRDKQILKDNEIDTLSLKQGEKIFLSMKRVFKDYNVEKWVFFVGRDNFENILYLHDAELLEFDMILHDSYKDREDRIVRELYKTLGLHNLDVDLKQHIFYYVKRKEEIVKSSRSFLFGKVELDADEGEE